MSTAEISELITQIDHVGIAVADLDAAIDWYGASFGLVVSHRETNESQGVEEAMLVPANSAQGAATSTALQLLSPLTDESTIRRFLDRNGPGMQQLAYRVTDLDAAAEHFRAKGIRLLYDEPRRGTADSRINFLHPKDAGGVLVELVEPAHGAPNH
ncbi:methylmalonyl-CoA epimerase [Hoyosella subflava]|uniref:Possible methylmalonyl-CoA epimerase n=1 Tax=Hoyosella subflava (strain DSM 45089 / JCM 17490 / NBRC 109087 / DQS3-9A1) TaxID=443218 RepID=F6ENL5_HOYSD|nr:methylmalonyl-CoA epimerase [Hoyosella subflava]AEF41684.1 Possible methylmalonyl-CoA epimerase [Hoyosella subflava DQS3-9A1]